MNIELNKDEALLVYKAVEIYTKNMNQMKNNFDYNLAIRKEADSVYEKLSAIRERLRENIEGEVW